VEAGEKRNVAPIEVSTIKRDRDRDRDRDREYDFLFKTILSCNNNHKPQGIEILLNQESLPLSRVVMCYHKDGDKAAVALGHEVSFIFHCPLLRSLTGKKEELTLFIVEGKHKQAHSNRSEW